MEKLDESFKQEIKDRAKKLKEIEYLQRKIESFKNLTDEDSNVRSIRIEMGGGRITLSRSKIGQESVNEIGKKIVDLYKKRRKELINDLKIGENYNI